jgi:hypothetical protein
MKGSKERGGEIEGKGKGRKEWIVKLTIQRSAIQPLLSLYENWLNAG